MSKTRPHFTHEIAPFANRLGYTDVDPFEVVRAVSEKTLEVRAMNAVQNPDWKPDFVPGGFSAHCTNNGAQQWIITPDPVAPVFRIRKHRDGKWRDASGVRPYVLSEKPRKFYDYNF